MKCLNCNHKNPEEARFCQKCGKTLDGKLCPDCGNTNPPDFNFCEECGFDFSLRICPICTHANQPDFRFCEECGHAFEEQALEPEPASALPEAIADPDPLPEPEPVPTNQAPQIPPPAIQQPLSQPPQTVYVAAPLPQPQKPKVNWGVRVVKFVFGSVIGFFLSQVGQYVFEIAALYFGLKPV